MRNRTKPLLVLLSGLCISVGAQQPAIPPAYSPLAGAGSAAQRGDAVEVPAAPPAAELSMAQAPGQVNLNVTVTDRSGKRVTGLSQSDFTLLEDKHPVSITGFRAWSSPASSPPVRLFLVIDTVNIRFDRVAYVRGQVNRFLRENGGRLAYPVTVLWVTDTGIEVNSDTTDNGDMLAKQLDATEGKLRILGRDAGDWGDIEQYEMSLQMLKQVLHATSRFSGRKLVIWLGPGWPMLDSPEILLQGNQQEMLFREVVGMTTFMRLAQTTLYSVSQNIGDVDADFYRQFLGPVKKPSDANPPNLALKVLATESGGLAVDPSNDLKHSIDLCAADSGPYYTIAFQPAAAGRRDEAHSLTVRVDRPGVTARTVTVYYGQPASARP